MHWLVYGQTGAGKSSYLKHEAAPRALRRKQRCIIYDPFGDSDWPEGAEIFSDEEKFWEAVNSAHDALIIYDETGSKNKNDERLINLAIMGRHRKLLCIFAAQRPQQINRSVRGQCSHIVVFHLVPKDAEFIADEWGAPILETALSLKTLHYIYSDRWGRSGKSEIKFDKSRPKP